jgi:hypothetical protein
MGIYHGETTPGNEVFKGTLCFSKSKVEEGSNIFFG